MLTRDEALAAVERARSAADLFGVDAVAGRRHYRALAAALHPDRNPGDTRAHAAAARLTALHADWNPGGQVATATSTYALAAHHAVGSAATVYRAAGPVVVKVVRDPALNPLIEAEWAALRALDGFTEGHRWLRPYYPRLLDTSGPVGRGERMFTVLDALTDGFTPLSDIRAAFPHGLDGRDYAWMHRRLLRAVAGAHRAGVVHGHITPDNVLIHPERHGVVLVGWTFAVGDGEPPLALDGAVGYPPEIRDGRAMTAATDVHMLHTMMAGLLAPTETRQLTFAAGCAEADPAARPTAVDLLTEYDDLLDELYGPRAFRPFAIPETGA